MAMLNKTPLLFIAILFYNCHSGNKHPYAIKDFRKPLQTQLTYVISKGIVGRNDDSLRQMITDKELVQLAQSEHPVLRATALREMIKRKSFDHFKVIMEHLDDTAIVATDAGEWGLWYPTVSDDLIEYAGWKTTEDKNKTIDAVITKHNYLRSAYTILLTYEPQEKHYSYIKDMALKKNGAMGYHYNARHSDRELALYGLAKYKKKEDVEPIRDCLLSELWSLGNLSFRLMSEYPDPVYLEVFEIYYPRGYYRKICREKEVENAIAFIHSLASYKNDRSARILDSILNKKPFVDCPADTNYLKDKLIHAIWDNPCPAYTKLRKQVEARIREDEKNRIEIPYEGVSFSTDSSDEKIWW